MDVRYQVFVSSTFVDLKEERSAVFQTLMEMDCIPAGMELFPAMDDEQWNFIKRIIDDCDYYILIMGSRYGSVSEAGISYTEMEYDYALEKGLKVLAFVHEHPEERPAKHGDSDPSLKQKLEDFRKKVCTGRLVKFWNDTKELPGAVALSLNKTIKTYPAIGWVRANRVATEEDTKYQNDLLRDIEVLRKKLGETGGKETAVVENLAGLDESFKVRITDYSGTDPRYISPTFTWRKIFTQIAPDLQVKKSDKSMRELLGKALASVVNGSTPYSAFVDNEDLKTIRTQLVALGLISLSSVDPHLYWEITPAGETLMLQERTVKAGHTSR